VLGRIALERRAVIFQKVREWRLTSSPIQRTGRRGRQRHGEALREQRHHPRDRAYRAVLPRKGSRGPRLHPRRPRRTVKGVNRSARGRRSSCRAPTRRCSSSCSSGKSRICDGTVMIRGAVRRPAIAPGRGDVARARRRSGRPASAWAPRAVDHPRAPRREIDIVE
jgi:hypothetical protein